LLFTDYGRGRTPKKFLNCIVENLKAKIACIILFSDPGSLTANVLLCVQLVMSCCVVSCHAVFMIWYVMSWHVQYVHRAEKRGGWVVTGRE
jgi:hypothetical protein